MAKIELRMGLFDPGMTAMHRAGLGGMAMSLKATKAGTVPGLGSKVEADAITLTFDEGDAEALARFVEAAMYCEGGLVRFAAFDKQSSADVMHMNECLLGTLLQHPKMLRPDGAKKAERVLSVDDGKTVVFRVKQLTDFVHRYAAREKLLAADGTLARKPIEIKGWAIPGAVQRHSKVAATTYTEPPERLLPLLFAPLGVVPMRIVGAGGSGKHRFVLLIPEVSDLRAFPGKRKRFAATRNMICAGPADAVLHFFAALEGSRAGEKLRSRCIAWTIGKVTWSSQQMTRTEELELLEPSAEKITTYNTITKHAEKRLVEGARSQAFWTVPAWRSFLTENLAAGRPLWAGLHRATTIDADRRKRLLQYERKHIMEIVNEMIQNDSLGNEAEQRFVAAFHQAIRQRWGALGERIRSERLDQQSTFNKDFEVMRVTLSRPKNAETFRHAVTDFWARAGRNSVLQAHWRDVLTFLRSEDWQLGRDLALLALASYPGKGSSGTEDTETDSDREEQDT